MSINIEQFEEKFQEAIDKGWMDGWWSPGRGVVNKVFVHDGIGCLLQISEISIIDNDWNCRVIYDGKVVYDTSAWGMPYAVMLLHKWWVLNAHRNPEPIGTRNVNIQSPPSLRKRYMGVDVQEAI